MRPVLLSAAFLTLAAGLIAGCNRPKPGKTADTGPLAAAVAKPKIDTITLFTNLTGTVEAKESVELRPRVSGYITEIKFKEGDEVKKDDPLVIIDSTIYKSQLKQAEGQVKNYEAQLQKAEADLARAQEAFTKGAAAKSEVDVNVANKGVAQAQLFTAKANVEQAKQNLEWTTVTAPIAGRVDRAYQTTGNLVSGTTTATGGTGTVLTTIVSVDPMYAYFDVDEQTVLYYRRLIHEGKMNSVQKGAQIPAKLQLRGETDFPHTGVLDFVSNRLNPGTGSLTIRGTFPNPDRFLLPGLYCRAQIPASKPFEAVLIPQAAVVNEDGRRAVFVVGPDNRAERRFVETGPVYRGLQVVSEGVTTDETGVRSGLGRNELVVIRGMQRLEPGSPLQPKEETIVYPPEPPPPTQPGGLPRNQPNAAPPPKIAATNR